MPNIVVGIPARYGSTRFPGKSLADLNGKPLIEHVYRRAAAAPFVEAVVVATDDERIAEAVRGFGGEVRMTSPDHASGSDRLAEMFESVDCKLVVNVQGDEPLIHPETIGAAIEAFFDHENASVATAATAMTRIREPEALMNPNIVKVTVDGAGFAMNFFRELEPPATAIAATADTADTADTANIDLEATPYFKHLGLYVYPRAFLLDFHKMPPSVREQRWRLEQFRMLDNGFSIRVAETPHDSVGVDTPEDLEVVRRILQRA